MKVTTSKSKNSESFYITQSYINSDGKSTSKRIRKLGTLKELAETSVRIKMVQVKSGKIPKKGYNKKTERMEIFHEQTL